MVLEVGFKIYPAIFRQNTWVLSLQMPYLCTCLAQKNLKPLFGLDSSFIQQAPIKYFAAPENQDLGVVKSIRKPNVKLIIAPFPAHIPNADPFFFVPSSQTPLPTAF